MSGPTGQPARAQATAGASVSIVIPNLNSPVIGRVLEAVRCQAAAAAACPGAHGRPVGAVEVLVVGLDEPGLVDAGGVVRKLDSDRPLPPAQARNRGLEAAQGEIIVFLDADCVPREGWLERLLAAYADPEVQVVGGSMALTDAGFWTLADNVATFHEYLSTLPAGIREQLPSFCLSCRRGVLEAVGGFDEAYPYPAGEDSDLTLRMRRAGYRLLFEPAAAVEHHPSRTSLGSLLLHARRLGQYSVKVDPRYASWLRVPGLLRRPLGVLLAAPLLAVTVTWNAFRRDCHLRQEWRVAPAMVAAKLAWCTGAAATLRWGAPTLAPWGTVSRLPPAPEGAGASLRDGSGLQDGRSPAEGERG